MSESERQLRNLERKLDTAVVKLSEAEDKLEEVREDIGELRKTQQKSDRSKASKSSARNSNGTDGTDGIRQIMVERQDVLGIIVHIDDRTLELDDCVMLLALFLAMCEKKGSGQVRRNGKRDSFVPMKTIDELLAFIKKRTGKVIDETTLRGHMSRLRKKMTRCKIRRSLIETGVRSYRFKLLGDGRVIE